MFVIFEGVDGSGKDTVMRAFNEVTKYSCVTASRLHLSCMAYDKYYRRKNYTDAKLRKSAAADFRKFMKSEKPKIVYVSASDEVLARRISQRGEDPNAGPDSRMMKMIFEDLIVDFGLSKAVFRIDTTEDPVLEDIGKALAKKIGIK